MSATDARVLEERVLVLAPTGRDATVACEVLGRASIRADICGDMDDVCAKLPAGAGALVLAEEALTAAALRRLTGALTAQPPWSDVPILILTVSGETTESRIRAISALDPSGNVTILERPLRMFSMIVTVQAMLRARRRQYQMRDLFEQIRSQMARLQSERELRARFVSLLAHDLRGPLSAASFAADLLGRSPAEGEKRREVTTRLKRSLERIERMVRDLLDTSRIQAGQPMSLQFESTELRELVSEIIEEVNTVHHGRVALVSGPQVRGVWGADQLRRAIWNLVTNAIKYGNPESPVTVDIRPTGDRVQISVHNRGNPISADDVRRIFEPFARIRNAESDSQLGWGLGLTLVRGCAEAHGGGVTVESDATTGTTFTIEIPLVPREAKQTGNASTKGSEPSLSLGAN